ncbi:MAG: PaaI family thioesterase [Marinilabiliales bacterium]|nr:PaaI family thioesterase [Marinilabiliales bacterium]
MKDRIGHAMKRAIRNPYLTSGRKDYNCFGCSPLNEKGLQLTFEMEDEEVTASWLPARWAEGFRNVLHGGIQATLLDELCSWVVQSKCGTVGVTVSMEIQYKKAVLIHEGAIQLRAHLKDHNSRFATVEGRILDNRGSVCATAVCKFFLFSPEKACAEYDYPGAAAFLESIGGETSATPL